MDSTRARAIRAIRAAAAVLALAAPAAAQAPAGGEFRANTFTSNRQFQSRTAMEPDGDFVVVWTSYGQDGSFSAVFGQRFAASGAPRGAEFRVNAYTTGLQMEPDVAVGSLGDFVVVWSSPQDGSLYGIVGRRFDAAGGGLGNEFLVNTFTTGVQRDPRVGRAADGRFVVSWVSPGIDGSSYGIAARRFDASGNAVGGEFVVNAYTTGSPTFADLAVEANGGFVAVWEDGNGRDGDGLGIFGQRYDASGNRLGSDFLVNSYTSFFQFSPSVSASPAGGFVVAWTGEREDGSFMGAIGRRFDAAGNAVGGDFVANTYTTNNQREAEVAHDARGNFVVTWTTYDGGSYGTAAQRFDAAGVRRGAEFRVNTYTTAAQIATSAASDAVGNFVVTWTSTGQDGSLDGVLGQRFGGLLPAALAVDGAGNGVLEPGENVGVTPAWRNVNGAAQIFTGALSDLTGPAGATYTITDAFADYLIVSNGATQVCADCYAVSVSNPPTRPVLHWDAEALETIVPDAQGQQKRWVLHVGGSFTDVPGGNPFNRFIETLLHRGVTSGCSPTAYCPASSTTREQMAVFVLVAREGSGYVPPACATPMFNDVPATSPFCRWIEELARRTVVGGCGGGNYCPDNPVTREQMAVFVLRALDAAIDPPPCAPPNLFSDVPETSPFCRWIEELALRGVVGGCGSGRYCPTAAVTREQIGVFLSATFGLTLYGL
jgi:S-layer family protein